MPITLTSGTMHGFRNGTLLPTAHLLPQPVFSPQIDALINGVPGWTWDLSEGILLSDMENFRGLGTANVDGSSGELTQNVSALAQWICTVGKWWVTWFTKAANPGIQYHTGLEHQQLSPAWHLIDQHDGMNHGGNDTGVYWPKMERDAGMRTQGANHTAKPMGGLRRVEYQVEPVASSGAAYDWSQEHPGSNSTAPLRVQMR